MEDLGQLNYWKNKNVLVTGSTGVIGCNLVNRLVSLDANVVTLIRDRVPERGKINSWMNGSGKTTNVHGSLEDYFFLTRVLAEYEVSHVFHLGAQTIVPVGNAAPLTTFKANIEGTWNLLEAARVVNSYSRQIESICVASSDKAYGSSKILPYTETMPLCGEHPYDVSKSCTDLIAQSYGKTYGLPVSVARMGNIYGPGDLNFNRIVPGTIRTILSGERPKIRSDGTPVREYFFVEDAVDAYLRMAEVAPMRCKPGEAFNFSSGEKKTVLELVTEILRLMKSDLEPEIQNTGRHEIQDQILSIKKAGEVLGWKPRHTLAQGLPATITWYKEVFG